MADYQQFLETIKNRLDIVDLVSERIPLKRRGRNWVGLCPFHAEKTPSFTVSPEKQMFYCFGCGAGGDAITFWMKIENLDFTEAVRDLADRLGIEIPKTHARGSSKRESYLAINRTAKEYFKTILLEDKRGEPALDYLKRRGLSLDMIKVFEIGFAPGTYGLPAHLEKEGLDPEDAVPIGILKKTDAGTYVPVFRKRIIFPIIDERGRTVGFGGRVLGEGLPKYFNSPDSIVFQKGRLFYGEAQTRREILRQRKAVLVEGYLDLISLYQLGISNGIAALGTAFTDFHAKRLMRWADSVVLLFDGDKAGYNASTRALEKLVRAGIITYQGNLPEGKDPGDYLKPPSVGPIKEVIANAEDAILYRIRRSAQGKASQDEIQGQEKLIKEGLSFLRLVPDPVRLDLYVKKAGKILGLKSEILFDIIKDYKKSNFSKVVGGHTKDSSLQHKRHPFLPEKRMEDAEEILLISLMQCPELAHQMVSGDILGMFRNVLLQAIGKAILEEIEAHGTVSDTNLMQQLNGEQQALLSRIMIGELHMTEAQVRKAFYDGLKTLYRRSLNEEISKLDDQIRETEEAGDFRKTITLLKRREAVKKNYQDRFIFKS